uniref:Pumilio homolog 5 isoform X1 n=1 Tax=Rhizophora mucronata TaxID=61149 RepID=A0A2P2P5P7_RHIMU
MGSTLLLGLSNCVVKKVGPWNSTMIMGGSMHESCWRIRFCLAFKQLKKKLSSSVDKIAKNTFFAKQYHQGI